MNFNPIKTMKSLIEKFFNLNHNFTWKDTRGEIINSTTVIGGLNIRLEKMFHEEDKIPPKEKVRDYFKRMHKEIEKAQRII